MYRRYGNYDPDGQRAGPSKSWPYTDDCCIGKYVCNRGCRAGAGRYNTGMTPLHVTREVTDIMDETAACLEAGEVGFMNALDNNGRTPLAASMVTLDYYDWDDEPGFRGTEHIDMRGATQLLDCVTAYLSCGWGVGEEVDLHAVAMIGEWEFLPSKATDSLKHDATKEEHAVVREWFLQRTAPAGRKKPPPPPPPLTKKQLQERERKKEAERRVRDKEIARIVREGKRVAREAQLLQAKEEKERQKEERERRKLARENFSRVESEGSSTSTGRGRGRGRGGDEGGERGRGRGRGQRDWIEHSQREEGRVAMLEGEVARLRAELQAEREVSETLRRRIKLLEG